MIIGRKLRSKGGRGVQWRRQHIPFRVRKATRAMSDTKSASQMKPVVTPHTTVCLSKMDCEDGETPKRMGTLRNPSKIEVYDVTVDVIYDCCHNQALRDRQELQRLH
jgi:hypothetical protein